MKFAILLIVAIAVAACSGAHLVDPLAKRPHRIVGGVESEPNDHPSILNPGFHSCAATLIHPKWALTAAHCVPIAALVAGDHDIFANDGTEQTRNVLRNIIHPSYETPTLFSNDFALLELETEFEINEFVRAVALPELGFEPTGEALVAGWGTTDDGTLAAVLRDVLVPIVPQADCIAAYGSDIDDSMICAGEVNLDSCQGDSGGPLYVRSADGSPVLVGVVSWGFGCGAEGFPGVYARTSVATPWINENVPAL